MGSGMRVGSAVRDTALFRDPLEARQTTNRRSRSHRALSFAPANHQHDGGEERTRSEVRRSTYWAICPAFRPRDG